MNTYRISDLDEFGKIILYPCKLCKKKFTKRQLIHHKTMCNRRRLYEKN